MTENLTLPGIIPGLLRKGSPVIFDYAGTPLHRVYLRDSKSIGEIKRGMISGFVNAVNLNQLSLDLTDITARAHAAWWLAAQAKDARRPEADITLENLHDLFRVTARFDPQRPCTFAVQGHRYGGAAIRLDQGFPTFAKDYPDKQRAHEWCHIDVLLDLDPNESRTLADGSRWIDAEALRRVILNVAGLED